ncbi:MAG TPA: hypothetical protein QGE93_04940, partial [Acidobacteriota bacterium]|nr:hypothetical protein [Acidobacteriota bacterium]
MIESIILQLIERDCLRMRSFQFASFRVSECSTIHPGGAWLGLCGVDHVGEQLIDWAGDAVLMSA